MKKTIVVCLLLAALCAPARGQEKRKESGQVGLYFESSEIFWIPLSGISLNLGKNMGKSFRAELAGTYYPIFFEDGGTTMLSVSAAALFRVADSPRLAIYVGPGFKLAGAFFDGESEWRTSLLFKGAAEYLIGGSWGMRAGFTQSLSFTSEFDEMDLTRMSAGFEWGFFWRL